MKAKPPYFSSTPAPGSRPPRPVQGRRHVLEFVAVLLGALLPLLMPGGAEGQIAEGQELISLPSTGRVHELTLNTQVATTVTFPSTITLVSGYGMVLNASAAQELIDAEKQAAAVSRDMAPLPVTMVHYAQAAPDTLVMRAVRRGTPCFLTVRCDSSIFMFKLVSGERANLAVVVQDPAASQTNPVREVKVDDVVASRTMFSSGELVGILSKARQREFLETVNPALYEGWSQRRDLKFASTFGDITTTINEIQQWPKKDALVLRARLENKGAKVFRYSAVDTKVRVGDRSYMVQLADGTGFVDPGKTALLDVVLQGNALGGKEHLSVQNDFHLELAEDTRTPPPPNDLLPPPQPLLPQVETPKHAFVKDQAPTVYYDGKVLMPDDPTDRRAPLPNLFPDK